MNARMIRCNITGFDSIWFKLVSFLISKIFFLWDSEFSSQTKLK